jgi:hypothetical protein
MKKKSRNSANLLMPGLVVFVSGLGRFCLPGRLAGRRCRLNTADAFNWRLALTVHTGRCRLCRFPFGRRLLFVLCFFLPEEFLTNIFLELKRL